MQQHLPSSAQIVVCILGGNVSLIRVFNQMVGTIITEGFLKVLWQVS